MLSDFLRSQTNNISDDALRLLRLFSWPGLKSQLDQRSLLRHIDSNFYTAEQILRATNHYIHPECQSVDQNHVEEIHKIFSVRIDLFKEIDRILDSRLEYHHTVLLAESDMGKSAFALNYYAYHNLSWRRRKRFNLYLVPLGIPVADNYIANIEDKENAVIILDAFDEDTHATDNYQVRLGQLLELCRPFRHILLTCRTQFFQKEEEISRDSGIMKININTSGESTEYIFYKLYVSPFSSRQVKAYLKRRFSLNKHKLRRQAENLIKDIPQITARPMLLAHINERLDSGKTFEHVHQIYEDIIEDWLDREYTYIQDKDSLYLFVENLAVDLYLNRKTRGSERIHETKLEPLALEFGISLTNWPISKMSILNYDCEGNYKFIHRTIMEYLFVRRLVENEHTVQRIINQNEALTGHMKYLLRQIYPQVTNIAAKPWLVALVLKYIGSRVDDLNFVFGHLSASQRCDLLEKLSQNSDPRPEVMTVKGMEFCYVPAGPFWMGSGGSKEEWEHRNDAIDYDYWISRFPITVAQFKAFVESSGYPPQDKSCLNDSTNRPVRYITRYDSLHFCQWLAKRWRDQLLLPNGYALCLPSEAEWEKAARGGLEVPVTPIIVPVEQVSTKVDMPMKKVEKFNRPYPWGYILDPNLANYNQTDLEDTSAVGCFPGGISPFGCEDMSGNLWEWTRSLYVDYPYNPTDGRENLKKASSHVLRGGSYAYPATFIRCSDRFCDAPAYRLDLLGFRVCIVPERLLPTDFT